MELVYVVLADMQEAEKLAKGLIDLGLVACVNIFPPVRSFYRWKGGTESSDEVVFLAKTTRGHFPLVEEYVRKHHSYEVPAIFSIPVEQVSESYRQWIFGSLDQGKES
jgi:periplasmic divalent cation tolerance protein